MSEQHDHGFFDDRCSVCVGHIDEPVRSREQTQHEIMELLNHETDNMKKAVENQYKSDTSGLVPLAEMAARIVSLLWGPEQ